MSSQEIEPVKPTLRMDSGGNQELDTLTEENRAWLLQDFGERTTQEADAIINSLRAIVAFHSPGYLNRDFANLSNNKLAAVRDFKKRIAPLLSAYERSSQLIDYELMAMDAAHIQNTRSKGEVISTEAAGHPDDAPHPPSSVHDLHEALRILSRL